MGYNRYTGNRRYRMGRPNFIENFTFWTEMVLSFVLVLFVFFAFLFFSITFIEERWRTITNWTKYLTGAVILMSLAILGTDYGVLAGLSSLVAHIAWFVVLQFNWELNGPVIASLIVGSIVTLASHFLWMAAFMNVFVGGMTALAFYILFVWGVPILVLGCFLVRMETNRGIQEDGSQKKGNFLLKGFDLIKKLIPRAGGKKD